MNSLIDGYIFCGKLFGDNFSEEKSENYLKKPVTK